MAVPAVFVVEFAEETLHYGEFFFRFDELGFRGEGSEGWMLNDLDDGIGFGSVFFFAAGFLAGQVEGGDLEAVEEEAGAARVDGVRGDAAEDLSDGKLDGASIFRQRQIEGGLPGFAILELGGRDGFSSGVVEVAKFFSAEAWAAAALALGVDVAALEASSGYGCVVHG